jgi:transcriptional regulator with XRE-family HTH domain
MLVPSLAETLTFGQLIAILRTRAGLQGQQLAGCLGLRTPTIARYERSDLVPTRKRLQQIAAALHLGMGDYTALLAAADYELDNDEWEKARQECAPILDRYNDPVLLLDYHTYLLCWNQSFQRLFDQGVALASRRAKTTKEDGLSLPPLESGMCALDLFLDNSSPLYHLVARDDRARLSEALIGWLAESVRRWNLPRLGGLPEWIAALVGHLQDLPASEGFAFDAVWTEHLARPSSARVRGQLAPVGESGRDDTTIHGPGHTVAPLTLAEPQEQLQVDSAFPPTFLVAGNRYALTLRPLSNEARLYMLHFVRADGPLLASPQPATRQQEREQAPERATRRSRTQATHTVMPGR